MGRDDTRKEWDPAWIEKEAKRRDRRKRKFDRRASQKARGKGQPERRKRKTDRRKRVDHTWWMKEEGLAD